MIFKKYDIEKSFAAYSSLLIASLFLCLTKVNAQEYSRIQGVVSDAESNEKLAFCNVGIAGKSFGTITNEEGFFELFVPKDLLNDSLQISFVGYKIFKAAVSELQGKSLVIKLEPSRELLEEVLVIKDNEEFARELVRNAVKNIKKNYPSSSYQMQAFYRAVFKQGGNYVRLEEAAVNIEHAGYRKHQSNDKIKVEQLRQSEDRRILGWKTALNAWLWGQNGAYDLLQFEPIRKKDAAANFYEWGDYYYSLHDFDMKNPKPKSKYGQFIMINDPAFRQYYDFRVAAITTYQGEEVYRIVYRNPYRDKRFYGEGELLIHKQNFALLSYKHQVRSESESTLTFEDNLISEIQINYRKYDNYYLPQLIRLRGIGDDSSPFARGSTSSTEQEEKVSQERILLVNDVVFNKRAFRKYKKHEWHHPDKQISDLTIDFDADFWKYYNILPDARLSGEILKNIKAQSLEAEQFER